MPEEASSIQSAGRRPRPEPEELPVAVVYEDESLIAIDKPPGMVVHPTYKNWSGTLLNAVLWHVRGRAGVEPSIVTRLDKDTSGLVLVALRPELHARIQRDGAAGRVRKEYLAIVRGTPTPARASIALPLARSLDDRRLVVVTATGQPSQTDYEVLSTCDAGGPEGPPLHGCYSLVRCVLVTGRTHQIRVHLAARGWPILGDRAYGEPHEALTRQALHAWRVSLPHPVTRERLEIEARIPADLQQLMEQNVIRSG
ncbi:MAG: RluA family pseudouridine synthase [Acidobacteria bacterium]|nr:RluA family pseudouridine synthase [Acidobacteriota bacterium]